ELEQRWVPDAPASLYIRPTMIATEPALGVHASSRFLHYIIVGPVGAYFATGFNPVPVYISDQYVRAVRGGTGEAKTGGNYAASLLVGEEVARLGYQQVLWLDGVERKYVEEVGAMNIAFAYGKHIITPQLTGTILPGITRKSVLEMAPDLGYTVSEERIEVAKVLADIERGEVTEVFGMGTAAVIAPVGKFGYAGKEYVVNGNQVGPISKNLYQYLTDLQYGRIPDPYGWTMVVG
ncbi:MAG TPA: branched-chain amino acid aminotransferase, partial [Anaerolineales bacterium]|nr:branched-chain amino acid aminotransferase [Anaerolineales bacterium]